jgi:hypothetical protein
MNGASDPMIAAAQLATLRRAVPLRRRDGVEQAVPDPPESC